MSYAAAAICYLDVIRAEWMADVVIRTLRAPNDLWDRLRERGWLRWRAEELLSVHPALKELGVPGWLNDPHPTEE